MKEKYRDQNKFESKSWGPSVQLLQIPEYQEGAFSFFNEVIRATGSGKEILDSLFYFYYKKKNTTLLLSLE